MNSYLKTLTEEFKNSENANDAVKMAAYMKNRYEFFGIKTPERRKTQNEFLIENGLPKIDQLEKLVFDCFDQPQRELHHFGIEVCAKLKKHWTPGTIKLFEKMTVTNSWWDSVDAINIFCIKPYFAKFPDADTYTITQSWIDSNNIWLQRLSLICQLRLTNKTDTKLLKRNILQLNGSDEFFIQKAIGWALRDYWRTDSKWVVKFVKENDLKPLSKREALKHN